MKRSWVLSGGQLSLACLLAALLALVAIGVSTEIPVGGVRGVVLLNESGKPLPRAAVLLRPLSRDDEAGLRPRLIRADAEGRFRATGLAEGVYEVEVSANAHQLKATRIQVREGELRELTLRLEPGEPYLTLYANQQVFLPEEDPGIQIHGFLPQESAIDVRVYQVSPERLLAERNFYKVFSPMASAANPEQLEAQVQNAKLVHQENWPIEPDDAEGTFKKPVRTPKLTPGFYLVRLQAGKIVRSSMITVSDLALVVKRAKDELHVFATDLKTGDPVANVPIRLGLQDGIRNLGTTGANGLLRASLPDLPPQQYTESAVVGLRGDSAAVVTFGDYSRENAKLRFFTATDRPIYRPGDRVQFKTVVRRPNGAAYRLPEISSATWQVQDLENRVLAEGSTALSPFGSLHGEFDLPKESTQSVRLIVKVDGLEDVTFVNVQSYRKPEFRISVTPVRSFYLRGDVVQFKVKAEYYFGGPVVGAKLDANLSKAPLWAWLDPETGEEVTYEDSWSGDFVTNLSGVTDTQGEATFSFRSRDIEFSAWENSDVNLVLQVAGSEGDERYFEGRGNVRLMQGDLAIRVDQDRYVAVPGDPVQVRIQLESADPSDARKLTSQTVSVETGYEIWSENSSSFEVESRQTVALNESLAGSITVRPPNPGNFRIRVIGQDRGGRMIQANAWVYAWREGAVIEGPKPDLQVMLDKRTYQAGETAVALIRGGDAGGSVWVTLETDRILEERVVNLNSGVTRVEFPVTAELKPNGYVTVSRVRSKRYREARRRLSLDLSDETLKVTVTPSKKLARPGETITLKVTSEDARGRAVPAEVALGVVDEALYAIAEDNLDPMQAFYPERGSLVSTFNSFPELYLDGGEKGGSNVEIRDDFRDTAAWFPTVMTDEAGQAEVQVQLPDNLTTWRATATAFSAATQIGKERATFVVNKDLMVRLSAATFMVEGDRLSLRAIVNNSTDRGIPTEVTLAAEGLTVSGPASQRVEVAPGRSEIVTWEVVAEDVTSATVTLTARGEGGLSDGVRQVIPIKPHGILDILGRSAQLPDAVTRITLPAVTPGPRGEFVVAGSSNLLAPLVQSLEHLVDFPYGCVEQTTHRFVPAVLARQALQELGWTDDALSAKIDLVTSQSLGRLREMQSSDGGWSWFGSEASDPWITAIVLEGLADARSAGISVDRAMSSNAVAWAQRTLAAPAQRDTNTDAMIRLAAATLAWTEDRAATRWLSTGKLKDWSNESLCVALPVQSDPARRDAITRELWSRATVRRDLITWPDTWGQRSTAMALYALGRVTPEDPRLDKVLIGLIQARRGDAWSSTYDTAYAVRAMLPALRKTGLTLNEPPLEMLLNGTPIPLTQETGIQRASMPLSVLKAGENEIEVRKAGAAVGFLSTRLTQVRKADAFKESGVKGVQIRRTFHRLVAGRNAEGELRLQAARDASESFTSGEVLRCRIVIKLDQPMEFGMIEVPLPSNVRVTDSETPMYWAFWYSSMDILDDRVTFFARSIPAGESTIELNVRAETSGTSRVLPAQVIEMYAPDRQARSSSTRLQVQPR